MAWTRFPYCWPSVRGTTDGWWTIFKKGQQCRPLIFCLLLLFSTQRTLWIISLSIISFCLFQTELQPVDIFGTVAFLEQDNTFFNQRKWRHRLRTFFIACHPVQGSSHRELLFRGGAGFPCNLPTPGYYCMSLWESRLRSVSDDVIFWHMCMDYFM